jgi:DNA polymerase I-like protein with 3'-5' exonuclease and polymerase domains
MALAYVDWSQQELGIGAALSGDSAMMQAYRSGDFYLSFAKQAGAVPLEATKKSHAKEREQFKICALAMQFGMGAAALARKLNVPEQRGAELIELHRRTYPAFWRWSDAAEAIAILTGKLQSTFGWTTHAGADANPRSLRNFPTQANGAEMMRIACCMATERGIRVCAPVHDALLVEGPSSNIDDVVRETQKAMREASELVLPNFPLRTDAKIVRYPDRYQDERGLQMWSSISDILRERGLSLTSTLRTAA